MRHLVTVVLACVIVGTVLAVSGALSPERAERGIAAFKDPFEVELATAIVAFDVPRVKALLPRATYQNLNDLRGNTTLFVYALERGAGGPASAERLEMVKALLKAGGFPRYPKGRALAAVASQGFEMNRLLLEAGADPSEREYARRAPWRRWVARDEQGREQVEMLRLFQKHGANLRMRDGGQSAVAEAVEAESWETALVLLEAGAYWQEMDLGAKARAALAKYEGREAPVALRTVVAKYF
jgi:hypothetical protein